MDLYTTLFATAPFILLAISGGVSFGPLPAAGRHRVQRRQTWWLVNDLVAVAAVILGAVICLLVIGEVIEPTNNTRVVVVTTGGLSLLLLLFHVVGDIVPRYRTPSAEPATESSDG